MQSKTSSNWIRFFTGLVVLLGLVFFVRLYSIQVSQHEYFADRSSSQHFSPYLKNQNRGSIIFQYKDGREFFAATNKSGYTLEINPNIIKNPEDTFNILSILVELDSEEFFMKARKENDSSEIIAKRIPLEVGESIIELGLQGVILSKEKWRFYPGKSMAAQIIGFQSYKGDEIKGRYGLERFYDDVLTKDGDSPYKNFFVQIFSGLQKTLEGDQLDGSIKTTIEPNVQTFTEEIVEGINSDWSSKKTGAIIMDPHTGAIYSMALAPTFDVNVFNHEESISIFNNHAVEDIFEMGSIIKPLTIAIGLDTGAITPESTYEDKGSLTLDGETIYNHDKEAYGVVDMQEVLNKSLNLGVSYVANKVGSEDFGAYMRSLLGERSGIDLPNEVSPQVSNLNSPRNIEYATASFGQGVAMNPVQTIRALATLSNGGYLISPHIGESIKYNLGLEKNVAPKEKTQIFKKETSETISRMLATAVDEALLGGTLALPNHSVGAKTGTAQIADLEKGGYLKNTYLHTFFGYFPAYDPEFIILLYTVNPKGVLYSHDTLARPFMDIVKYLINYYQVEPDR